MKSKIMPTAILGSICLIAALLLSVVNLITAPEIARRQEAEANAALIEVLPDGQGFEKLDVSSLSLDSKITSAWAANTSGGYVFRLVVTGYKPGLTIMCGVDADGKIAGVKHVETNETYGLEEELDGVYIGKSDGDISKIIATGATPNSATSNAYYTAMTTALDAYAILEGGN